MSIEQRPVDEIGAERWDGIIRIAENFGLDGETLNKRILVNGQIISVMTGLVMRHNVENMSADEVAAFIGNGLVAYEQAYPDESQAL